MIDVILDTLIDSVKMLPFLFVSFLIIEYIEHKNSKKIRNTLVNSGKYGSIVGALLGSFPQCGFSVTASNLYASRVITLGTLISVFLATSDEAILVLLSNPGRAQDILKIIAIKIVIAIIIGMIIDTVLRRIMKNEIGNSSIEKDIRKNICSHCDCEHSMTKSVIKHTVSIFAFILIISLVLNTLISSIGEERLSTILLNGSIFQPFIAALIGMIPNCASSVILTELYLAGTVSFASIIAGLCTGAGIGLAVLFKVNKNVKENVTILGILYSVGVLFGIVIEIIQSII